jgi:hypothetical protein
LRTARAAQAKSAKLQNALEMGKQHLDVLAIAARLLERCRTGQCAGDIAGARCATSRGGGVGRSLANGCAAQRQLTMSRVHSRQALELGSFHVAFGLDSSAPNWIVGVGYSFPLDHLFAAKK